MRKPFNHLGQHARDRMEALLAAGETQRRIAAILKVAPSTISRERKRQRVDGRYDATVANHKARVMRRLSKYQGMKMEADLRLKAYVIAALKEKRSPDEIAGRMKKDRVPWAVGKDAIYHWLYSVWGARYAHYLCTKRWRRKPHKNKTGRTMIPNRVSIHVRPRGATNKTRYGHFEADTAVAPKRAQNTEGIAVAAERKTKLMLATKIPSQAPRHMTRAMQLFQARARMQSATMDNGIENKDHEAWGIPTYFCDPHSPWQKPLAENSIGLLRRWYWKKGTDWKTVGEEELQQAIAMLNNKYRKSLNYENALEVARAHGIMKKKLF